MHPNKAQKLADNEIERGLTTEYPEGPGELKDNHLPQQALLGLGIYSLGPESLSGQEHRRCCVVGVSHTAVYQGSVGRNSAVGVGQSRVHEPDMQWLWPQVASTLQTLLTRL
jgi:hypothetical protein